jgi:hypothetical protein
MYATPLLQHEYNNGRRRKKNKYICTYFHTYIHTSDMIIGCALKGLRAPGLSTKQVQ